MKKTLFGYNDILSVNTPVIVKRTGHKAIISKVVGRPKILHCTCYHIEPKDPEDLGGHWYFRHNLELRN